jgi:hypothetical protein
MYSTCELGGRDGLSLIANVLYRSRESDPT